MNRNATLQTAHTILFPLCVTGEGGLSLPPELAEAGAHLPPALRGAKDGTLWRVWCVCRRDGGQAVGWVWIHDVNEALCDAALSFCADTEDTDALMEAVLKARCTLAGSSTVRVVTTETENAEEVERLRRCGFTLARLDGERFVLEYVMQSSRCFPLYLGASAVLTVLLHLVLSSWMSAACVGLCLGLASGYLHQLRERQRFLRRRASRIFAPEGQEGARADNIL